MRKLLLATTATLSGFIGMAGIAHAQLKLNDGTPYTSDFVPGGGLGVQQPAPGNIVVHFNGAFRVGISGYFNNYGGAMPASAFAPAGQQKMATVDIADNIRLYPGFDGVAANGLRYGAYLEIRNDSQKNTNFSGGVVGATVLNSNTYGITNGGATSAPDVSARARDAFYTYQDWGYIGLPSLGTIRMGQLFVSNAMLLTGTMENFNDGGWHSWQTNEMLGSIPWPFVNNGVMLGANSIQYLSPQIAGFDFSATFQPNDGGGSMWSGCTLGVAGPGCNMLSSTTDPNGWARRTTWIDGAVRYRGTFGPVGLAASVGGIFEGVMKHSAGSAAATNYNTYRNGSEILGGVQVTYGGLLVGGHIEHGNDTFQQQLEVEGGKPLTAWDAGFSYTMGALTAGVQYMTLHDSHGVTSAAIHGYTARGPYVGAQYTLAPGLLAFAGFAYAETKQTGKNLYTGAAGTANNDIHSSYATIGTVFSW